MSLMSLKEPDANAEPWAWTAYFDGRLCAIRQDGFNLARFEAECRRQWGVRKPSKEQVAQRKFNAHYLREINPSSFQGSR
jgi:hypothetical protein